MQQLARPPGAVVVVLLLRFVLSLLLRKGRKNRGEGPSAAQLGRCFGLFPPRPPRDRALVLGETTKESQEGGGGGGQVGGIHIPACSLSLGAVVQQVRLGESVKELFPPLITTLKLLCTLQNAELGIGEWRMLPPAAPPSFFSRQSVATPFRQLG